MVGVPTSAVNTASYAALAQNARQILRMDRFVSRRSLGEVIEPRTGFAVVDQASVEVRPVGFHGELRQQRLDRGADIADQAKIELAAAAKILRPDVELRDLAVHWKKLLVRKIRPQHQQRVAGVHRRVTGGES